MGPNLDVRSELGREEGKKDGLNEEEEEGDEYGGVGREGGVDDKDVNTVWVAEDNIQ